jgi:hypothetical protein
VLHWATDVAVMWQSFVRRVSHADSRDNMQSKQDPTNQGTREPHLLFQLVSGARNYISQV